MVAYNFRCFVPLLSLLAISLFNTSFAAADEPYWNQFRGPHADGTSKAIGLPLKWSEKENIVWKTPVHGRGWSSPVIWKDQIWMTTATKDGKELSVVCVDLNTRQNPA